MPAVGEIEFFAWVAQAEAGDRIEYHRGFLVLDTFPLFSHLDTEPRTRLLRLGEAAYRAAEQGLVHLVQERVGPDEFAYIAIARPKSRKAQRTLADLLFPEEAA